jgi:hypothetical protein
MGIARALRRVKRQAQRGGLGALRSGLGEELRSGAIPRPLRKAARRIAALIDPNTERAAKRQPGSTATPAVERPPVETLRHAPPAQANKLGSDRGDAPIEPEPPLDTTAVDPLRVGATPVYDATPVEVAPLDATPAVVALADVTPIVIDAESALDAEAAVDAEEAVDAGEALDAVSDAEAEVQAGPEADADLAVAAAPQIEAELAAVAELAATADPDQDDDEPAVELEPRASVPAAKHKAKKKPGNGASKPKPAANASPAQPKEKLAPAEEEAKSAARSGAKAKRSGGQAGKTSKKK